MIAIGRRVGLRTEAVLTGMDVPLGRTVGNALEIRECVDTLKGAGPADLEALCLTLAGRMLRLGGAASSVERCEAMAREALSSGRAFERFGCVVERQGGDARILDDPGRLPRARRIEIVAAGRAGYIQHMRADGVGQASVLLGAGRDRIDAAIDPAAGIVLLARPGDRVAAGDAIAELHAGTTGDVAAARARFTASVVIGDAPLPDEPIVLGVMP
jgi:thymidine phosphorylase